MSNDCPPGLAVSKDDKLDYESIANDPSSAHDSGSGGENGDNIFHDHPSHKDEPAPPLPAQNLTIVESGSAPVPEAPNNPSEGTTDTEGAGPVQG